MALCWRAQLHTMCKIALAHPFSDTPPEGDMPSQTDFWAAQLLVWHKMCIFAIQMCAVMMLELSCVALEGCKPT